VLLRVLVMQLVLHSVAVLLLRRVSLQVISVARKVLLARRKHLRANLNPLQKRRRVLTTELVVS